MITFWTITDISGLWDDEDETGFIPPTECLIQEVTKHAVIDQYNLVYGTSIDADDVIGFKSLGGGDYLEEYCWHLPDGVMESPSPTTLLHR